MDPHTQSPTEPLARVGWIFKVALSGLGRCLPLYFLGLGYAAAMGILFAIWAFLTTFGWLFLVAIALQSSDFTAAGWLTIAWILGLLVVAGLIGAGYNGGMIRALSPVPFGGAVEAGRFIGGAVALGPKLFLVYVAALIIASIPRFALIGYFFDLTQTWGWGVIESGWNRSLQLEILAAVRGYAGYIAGALVAMNVILGPWQIVVAMRRSGLLLSLPVTLTLLAKHLLVAAPVLGLNFAIAYGLEQLAATNGTLALFLTFLVTPFLWLTLLALLAPEIPASEATTRGVSRPPHNVAPQGLDSPDHGEPLSPFPVHG